MLLREVPIRYREYALHPSATAQHCDALRFVELVPQWMGCRSSAPDSQVTIGRDLADDVRRDVQPTSDYPSRSPAADAFDEVSEPIRRPGWAQRARQSGCGLIVSARRRQESNPSSRCRGQRRVVSQ